MVYLCTLYTPYIYTIHRCIYTDMMYTLYIRTLYTYVYIILCTCLYDTQKYTRTLGFDKYALHIYTMYMLSKYTHNISVLYAPYTNTPIIVYVYIYVCVHVHNIFIYTDIGRHI